MSQPEKLWSVEQVDRLNKSQLAGNFHPYTCGNSHCPARPTHGSATLVATVRGWMCVYCDYTQNWAHGVAPEKPSDTC